mgnify:FL=1
MIKAFSFGGGVQSMAALVLAAQGRIDYKTFLFANVGDDSEFPQTMTYLREVAVPFAEKNNLNLVELHRTYRDGRKETLWQPMRVQSGAPGARSCTADFKIKVVSRWMKENGATKESRGTVGIGISVDEIQRMRPSQLPHIINAHPLIDLELTRDDCRSIIRDAGLPVPPKSSCFFCPFHSKSEWKRIYDEHPDLFQKSVALERMINERQVKFGRSPMYLSSALRPLDEVINGSHRWQLSFLEKDDQGQYSCGPFTCDGGSGGDDSADGLIINGGPSQ